ncbi:hypothetical protein J6590_102510, partial [Homalodisca vitripennis]
KCLTRNPPNVLSIFESLDSDSDPYLVESLKVVLAMLYVDSSSSWDGGIDVSSEVEWVQDEYPSSRPLIVEKPRARKT